MYRVEWIRHQEREKKKLEDEKEKERGLFVLWGVFNSFVLKGKFANCDALHNNTEKSLLRMIYFMMTVITIIDYSDETKKNYHSVS